MEGFFNVPALQDEQQEEKGLDYYRPYLVALQSVVTEVEGKRKQILQKLAATTRKYPDGFVFNDGQHLYQVVNIMPVPAKGYLKLDLLYQVKNITPHCLIIVDTAFFFEGQIDQFLAGR